MNAVTGKAELGFSEHATPVPETKRPLTREVPPAPPFPIEALGSLRPAAEAIHVITQAPLAICAQSVLAVATLAIQAHRDVEGPIGRRPVCGLFVSRAESGERKSAVDRLALSPVVEIEKEWREAAEIGDAVYRNAKEAWDEARAAAKKKANGNKAHLLAAFDEIGPEPAAPLSPVLLVSDATPEAVAIHLAGARPFGGQFTAEGGLVVGGTGMSKENRMRAGAFYNVIWDGDPIRRNRASSQSAFLPGRRMTAHLMMQPNVSAAILADDTLTQIGTVNRLLVVAPATTAGTRLYRKPPPSAWAELEKYYTSILEWLRKPYRTEGDSGALDPNPMTLDAEAEAIWVRSHDLVEKDLGPNGALAGIRGWGSKMPEHALRLAAVIAAADDPNTLTIGKLAMKHGITLAQYYAAEMLRLAGDAGTSPDLQIARRLLEWWQSREDGRCHLATIYQTGPAQLRDATTARRIVAILVEHGWVKPLPPGTNIDGRPRREAWEIIRDFDGYAAAGLESEASKAAKHANPAKVAEIRHFREAHQSEDDAKLANQTSVGNAASLARTPQFSGGLAAGTPHDSSALAGLATLAPDQSMPLETEGATAAGLRCGWCGADAQHIAAAVNPASWLCDRCWPSDPVDAAYQATERAAIMEKPADDPAADAHFMPVTWRDASMPPTSGARCRCCGASNWWGDDSGWSCETCHPAPPTCAEIKRIRT